MRKPDDKKCRYCDAHIRLIKFDTGPQWMHIDVNAVHPTARNQTMWWSCQTVAEPAE